jgi:uncharacterized phage protein (TIGR02220 family)
MSRIRTYKPSFWSDEKLATISRDARLLFLGIITHSDDYGVCKGHHLWIKSQVFPYEAIKPELILSWMSELETLRLIIPFDQNGEKYIYIKNFTKHQRVDNPSKMRNPQVPIEVLDSPSRDNSETLATLSPYIGIGIGIGKSIGNTPQPPKGEDIPFDLIIQDLNKKSDKNYSPDSEAHRKRIRALWKAGHRLPDFEKVHTIKCEKWKGDPKWDDYLRPKTLYQQDNFESYLNESKGKPPVPPLSETDRILRDTELSKARARKHAEEEEAIS